MQRIALILLLGCASQTTKTVRPAPAPATRKAPPPAPPQLAAVVAQDRAPGRAFRYFTIDIQRTLNALEDGKKKRTALMKLFNDRQSALNQAQRELKKLTDKKERERRRQAVTAQMKKMQEELDEKEHQALAELLENLRLHVRSHLEVAGAPTGFELLDGAALVHAHGACDISDWLIESYNRGQSQALAGPACFALHMRLLAPSKSDPPQLLEEARALARSENALLLVHIAGFRMPLDCRATEWLRARVRSGAPPSAWPPPCEP